jgi:hypothetical protein
VAQLYHPQLGQTVNFEVHAIPDGGDGQTSAVIDLMTRYARQDSGSPEIQAAAREAVAEYSDLPPWEAVFWYVKRRLRFVRDEQTAVPFQEQYDSPVVETLIRPMDMVTLCANQSGCIRQGDCDDFSMYTASLLMALGIPCKFVTVAASTAAPDEFSHVYVAAYPPPAGQRVPLDTSHGHYPGWETKAYTRIQEWNVSAPSITDFMLPVALIAGVAYLCR